MKIPLLAAAAIMMIPLAGIAQDEKTPSPTTPSGQAATFDTLDANQDGRISMPEASADPKLMENFSTVDKNGDGYLDNAEFDSSTTPPQQ